MASFSQKTIKFVTSLVQYEGAVRELTSPYPGLKQFKVDRKSRDMHFGGD